MADPAKYDHALVEITSFVSHGFEDFKLFDPECPSGPRIWVEYGGTVSYGTVYCCGGGAGRGRAQSIEVEGIRVPLTDDAPFREFDRLMQRPPDSIARATLIARFFSGHGNGFPGNTGTGGYGHLGCCSLAIIQQVLSVEPQTRADLDYRASIDEPELCKSTSTYRILTPGDSTDNNRAAQRDAEQGRSPWAFTDSKRVASGALATFLEMDPTAIAGMKTTKKSAGRVVYRWAPRGKKRVYAVVTSRPYWLSFYAQEPGRVAWVVVAAYEAACN